MCLKKRAKQFIPSLAHGIGCLKIDFVPIELGQIIKAEGLMAHWTPLCVVWSHRIVAPFTTPTSGVIHLTNSQVIRGDGILRKESPLDSVSVLKKNSKFKMLFFVNLDNNANLSPSVTSVGLSNLGLEGRPVTSKKTV